MTRWLLTFFLVAACDQPPCTAACGNLVEGCDASPFADAGTCVQACVTSQEFDENGVENVTCYARAECDPRAILECARAEQQRGMP